MAAAVHHLPLFMAAALLVNLTPGTDMLFVATSSVSHGRRAGVLAALGVGADCLLHVALAALGLSALLAASAPAFLALRWVGAAYLVWMGLSMWRVRESGAAGSDINSPVSKVFWQGVWTNALTRKWRCFSWRSCRSSSIRMLTGRRFRSCCSGCCSASAARWST